MDRVDPGSGLEIESMGAREETDEPPLAVLCPDAESEAEGFGIDLHVVVADEHGSSRDDGPPREKTVIEAAGGLLHNIDRGSQGG